MPARKVTSLPKDEAIATKSYILQGVFLGDQIELAPDCSAKWRTWDVHTNLKPQFLVFFV